MSAVPAVLKVEDLGDGRWSAPHPADDPEGRDVVFSGQILAQMIMASDAAVGGQKEVKSIHAIFARAGTYSAGLMELRLEPMHSGRAWGSDTITAYQGDRLLSRGLVLLNTVEPDLMRHMPAMPDVPGPDAATPNPSITVFPGAEARLVDMPDAVGADGSPAMFFWTRNPESYDSVAANQAAVAWTQPGFIIGLAMRPHSDTVNIADAHSTISTGVISHTAHFHEPADVGEWLLVAQEASYAGHGRVSGPVRCSDRTGRSCRRSRRTAWRGVEGTIDPKTGM